MLGVMRKRNARKRNVTPLADEDTVSITSLYEMMRYCVTCGKALVEYVVDIKECPDRCGRVHPDKGREGMVGILFEPTDERGIVKPWSKSI